MLCVVALRVRTPEAPKQKKRKNTIYAAVAAPGMGAVFPSILFAGAML